MEKDSMNVVEKAIRLATIKHAVQVDKGCQPYILHPLRVMLGLKTDDQELMAIAVLHDIVEDTDMTPEELMRRGFSRRIVKGVYLLTRMPGQNYIDYIIGLQDSRDALLVKRQDLLDNLDTTRLKRVTKKDQERIDKYKTALRLVEIDLIDMGEQFK